MGRVKHILQCYTQIDRPKVLFNVDTISIRFCDGWISLLCLVIHFIATQFVFSQEKLVNQSSASIAMLFCDWKLQFQWGLRHLLIYLVHLANQLRYQNETHRRMWLHLQRIPYDTSSRMILWCLCSSHQHDSYLYWWHIRRYLKGIIPHFDKVVSVTLYFIRRHLFIHNKLSVWYRARKKTKYLTFSVF